MKKKLSLFLLFVVPTHGGTLFLNSVPMGAEVFSLEGKRSRQVGKTPLILSNAGNVTVVLQKSGHAPQTNSYQVGTGEVKIEEVILAPLSFTVNFPVDSGAVRVNGENYTSLDGNLSLPYANYNTRYDRKKGLFVMEAKSPYTPYVGIFTTTLILSLGMVVGGFVAQPIFRQQFFEANDINSATTALNRATAMNNIAWIGVGVSTGSLIGLSVSAHYEAKERRRIRRFSARQSNYEMATDLTDFTALISQPPSAERFTAFIRKHERDDSRYIPQVYLLRARFYAENQREEEAVRDINTIFRRYPAFDIYGSANRLLGEIYLKRNAYSDAYQAFKAASMLDYSDGARQMLNALSQGVQQGDASLRNLLEEEIRAAEKDRRFTDRSFLEALKSQL